MNPFERTWTVIENTFQREQIHYYETILSIGNGYLGVRATFEEGFPDEIASTLVHGIFNHHPEDLVPDLANVPAWFAMTITVDGNPFRLDNGKILGYERRLDLRTGVLRREVLWQSPGQQILRIEFERWASMADSHLLMQQVKITALDAVQNLEVEATIDHSKALNIAYASEGPLPISHWTTQASSRSEPHFLTWQGTTNESGYQVILAQYITADHTHNWEAVQTEEALGTQLVDVALAVGESITLTRYTAIATSRDAEDPTELASTTLHKAIKVGYEALKAENNRTWADLWEDMDIHIQGDELAQLAIRFVTYHLLISAPRHDERVSIGAKTLSGPGYKGHVFWDTELFMLPPFTLSYPSIARNLLMYRYHNLQGAREKAQEAGFRGAMFPWESTDTGKETTPRWTLPDKDGNRIRIWTGDNEQHISSDIAYAVYQYWQWTGDDEFLRDYGAEMCLDTALFWESRVEWNALYERYELSEQIGPDEFHENINNTVYTNRLVQWHLETALELVDWLEAHFPEKAHELQAQLGILSENLDQWRIIAEQMYIPRNPRLNVYEQFDGFFERNWVDVSAYYPRTANLDATLGHTVSNASQIIKQADVVMLIALLGEALGDHEELMRNWETYLPRTAHDSSLSPAIHAWVGAKLGLVEEAYQLWMKSAGLDLQNNKGNVRDGIHAAACGGLREAIIFGFAGLELDSTQGQGWKLTPNLPQWWQTLTFSFYYHGEKQTITLENPNYRH